MLQSIKIISVALLCLATACVSKKEYNAAVEKKNEYYARMQNLISDSVALATKSDRLAGALGEEMVENNMKERQLRMLRERLIEQNGQINQLNKTLANALVDFNAEELTVSLKEGKVYVSLSDQLLFSSGSATINGKGKQALAELSEVLNDNPDIRINVEGHTDNVPVVGGLYKDNWDLSLSRAATVVRALVEDYGVSPNKVTASGKSKYDPLVKNTTDEMKQKNRRIEIILSPDLGELYEMLSYKK